MSDSLGRVMVMDTDEGEIIRIFKGVRDAQIGWIQVADTDAGINKPVHLVLAIYAVRGVLELFLMRHGQRISILNVGSGMRLVQSSPGVLGGMYWRLSEPNSLGPLSSCFLISPNGDARLINVSYQSISNMINNSGRNSTLLQLSEKYAMISNATAQAAALKEMQEIIDGLTTVSQKLNALSTLSSAVPADLHLNILRKTAVDLGVDSLTLVDCLTKSQSTAASRQQAPETKSAIEVLTRIHLLQQYQRISRLIANHHHGAPSDNLGNPDTVQHVAAKFDAVVMPAYIPSSQAWTPSSAAQKLGARAFSQAFTVLAIKFLKAHSFAHIVGESMDRLSRLTSVILQIVQVSGGIDVSAVNLLMEFAWSSKELGYVIFVSGLVESLCVQFGDHADLGEIRVLNEKLSGVIDKLCCLYRDCSGLVMPCAPNELDKTTDLRIWLICIEWWIVRKDQFGALDHSSAD
eukprot:jgi/Hompol1/6138/HPOL_000507-RA